MRLSCHAGLRAPRYARNQADLEANPSLFRCDSCGALLDGPEWAVPQTFTCPTCLLDSDEPFCSGCGAQLSGRPSHPFPPGTARPGNVNDRADPLIRAGRAGRPTGGSV